MTTAPKTPPTSQYRFAREFSLAHQPPQEIVALLDAGELVDCSWHNDVTPSFYHRDLQPEDGEDEIRLWAYPERPEDREYPDCPRFNVSTPDGDPLIETDDVSAAIAYLRAAAAEERRSPRLFVLVTTCPECARSNGPHFSGRCPHGEA